MADVTVAQFAEVLKVTVDKLLAQLDEAGIKVEGYDDRISDEAKLEFLTHLRRKHGQGRHARDRGGATQHHVKTQVTIGIAFVRLTRSFAHSQRRSASQTDLRKA